MGDDGAQRDLEYTNDELFDYSVLDQPVNESTTGPQDKSQA